MHPKLATLYVTLILPSIHLPLMQMIDVNLSSVFKILYAFNLIGFPNLPVKNKNKIERVSKIFKTTVFRSFNHASSTKSGK